jgi:hypothetical protein
MIVKELIEQLKELPENYSIVMESGLDTIDFDIHQLDDFEEIVLAPKG